MHDAHLDIDARDAAFAEAKALIRYEFALGDDRLAAVEAERILADMKRRLLKKMSDEELALVSSEYTSETATTESEDVAITAVALCRQKNDSAFEHCWHGTPGRPKPRYRNSSTLWEHCGSGTRPSARGLRHLPGHRRDARRGDRQGVSWPGRGRAQGRRPWQQACCREAIQAASWP